jgi:hypothetical protein
MADSPLRISSQAEVGEVLWVVLSFCRAFLKYSHAFLVWYEQLLLCKYSSTVPSAIWVLTGSVEVGSLVVVGIVLGGSRGYWGN